MIDAHHHLWDLEAVHYPWLMARGVTRFFGDPTPIQRNYPVEEFKADALAHGATASVHVQVGAADPLAEARWVQAQADASPHFPAVQVANCDLTAPEAGAILDQLQKLPTVVGIRQIVGRSPEEDAKSGENSLLAAPAYLKGLQDLARRGLRYDVQLIPEIAAQTAEVLAQVPDLPVALCHCGSPRDLSAEGLAGWEPGLRALAALPQVTCKLSGLGMFADPFTTDTIRPVVDTVLDAFGPDRVMFGSNFPVDSLRTDYAGLMASYREIVPEAAQPAVFHTTAARFYGLA